MPDRVGRVALVVIDVQKAILDGLGGARPAETASALDAVVCRIAGLLARARTEGVPVIHVQHDGRLGHRLAPGGPGWELRTEVAPRSGEIVIHKRACDAFFETPLGEQLSAAGATGIVVAGCMTEYCVDTTVRRAVSLGFDVVLAEDGHMTADAAGLRFEQIIAHHNALLDGFDAGAASVRVCPVSTINF
jgi:nicotinamidase-related amidase